MKGKTVALLKGMVTKAPVTVGQGFTSCAVQSSFFTARLGFMVVTKIKWEFVKKIKFVLG